MSEEAKTMSDQAVRDLYQALLAAWNRRDAAGMASLYAEGGVQIGFDGSTAVGPAEIRAQLAPIFTDHPTRQFVSKVREVRELAPGVALLRATAGMVDHGDTKVHPEVNTLQTVVARQVGEAWKIELFQNTPAAFHGRPEEQAALTRELQAAADGGN
jgi:uncharacterized protein (TIGR02246 family)